MSEPFVYTDETFGYPPESSHVEKIMRKVAERIIQETSFRFENKETGEIRSDSSELPISDKIRLQSGYNDWKYWNGIINMAMVILGRELGDNGFKEYALANYRFAFKHLPYFRKLYDAEIYNADFHQFFRMDRLDDCAATGAGLIEAYREEKNEAWKQRIYQTADHIMKRQERLEDGTFIRIRFNKTTLWADDLYMSVPFLVRMAQFTGENLYLEEAVRQAQNFHERLYSETKGLYHHCWYKEIDQYGVAFWGRANGWIMMALTELMSFLPENYPQRETIQRLFFSFIVGVSRYQGKNGLWHQLLDKPDSFEESSSTAMFVYGIAKAVNNQWIDDMYASIAVRGWEGLEGCISESGDLDCVSTGFNLRQDLPYYYNRPVEKKGVHGEGAFLLAANEVRKMKQYRDTIWC
jgi:rhamnogalacturonyl hydrolase YesR